MKPIFAEKEDLNRLLEWCSDVPEYQKKLSSYLEDRNDTAVVIVEEEHKMVAIALLKVQETEKKGYIWIYSKHKDYQSQPDIMQFLLKWLRKQGAKEYNVI
ncbi:GNAT family N-acetyltransferase [Fictibacillus nanhaiensis]|uniref:GNAT family N-acetyltransferase n=1 Tax=Fictibacillus nanhaiensis TaxID=742169 RepID=UPI003C29C073